MFYLKHENHQNCGCFHPAMMKCREIIVETSLTGAVPLQCLREGRVFHSLSHPVGAGRWIGTHSVTSLFVKPFLNRITEAESSPDLSCLCVCPVGTSVMQVTATDADDPTYGNSARLVYSILQGQPYFSVEPQTGEAKNTEPCPGTSTPQPNTGSQPRCSITQRDRLHIESLIQAIQQVTLNIHTLESICSVSQIDVSYRAFTISGANGNCISQFFISTKSLTLVRFSATKLSNFVYLQLILSVYSLSYILFFGLTFS